MKNARHIGRSAANDDKKFEFASPDARSSRSAFHRYMPVESHVEMTAQLSYSERGEDSFDISDFRARWWPAPDVAE